MVMRNHRLGGILVLLISCYWKRNTIKTKFTTTVCLLPLAKYLGQKQYFVCLSVTLACALPLSYLLNSNFEYNSEILENYIICQRSWSKLWKKNLCKRVFITVLKIVVTCSVVVGQLNKLWHVHMDIREPVMNSS